MFNPKTEFLLNSFAKRPSSSILLLGDYDKGSADAVKFLKDKLLIDNDVFNFIEIKPNDKGTIGIEEIRELGKKLAGKLNSFENIARIVVVYEFNEATLEAQNALLKILEETPNKTLIIIQSSNSNGVLSTIKSRCQTINLLPITRKQAIEYTKDKPNIEADKLLLLSNGDSKRFEDLTANSENLKDDIEQAKIFIKSDTFERLLMQKDYSTVDKLQSLIKNLKLISVAALHSSTTPTVNRWKDVISELMYLEFLINKNVNTKILYLRLCVNL